MSNDDFQPRSGVKFGGAHSPGKVDATMKQNPIGRLQSAKVFNKTARRADAGRTRSWLIILLTLPLVLAGIIEMLDGNAFGAIRNIGLFALFCFAATTIRSNPLALASWALQRRCLPLVSIP